MSDDSPILFARSFGDAPIPAILPDDPRVRLVTKGKDGHRGEVVVYWTQAARRAHDNAALSRAIAEANLRKQPLLVYESLRVDYPYASDRIHAFVLQAARESAAAYRARGAGHVFFLPRSAEAARGKVLALAKRASLLVTDDHPGFLFPAHVTALAETCPCPVLAVDDTCVIPLSLFPKEEYAARTIRPKVVRLLPAWLRPLEEPSCKVAPRALDLPFTPFDVERADLTKTLAALPIDHGVPVVEDNDGARSVGLARLARFVSRGLSVYAEEHNHPDESATTGLSAHLHFGIVGAREAALSLADARADLGAKDAFLEQLLVRRTLAFNLASRNALHRTYAAVPDWAKKTLAEHRADKRDALYDRDALESARTGDEVWNAAQRELRTRGVIHNYLRMLWGKCVIAWKRTPEEAFDELVHLNDRWALDGRDPNTYASILWCFGKHDRPWGPARKIFGTVRYMSTAAAMRKLKMEDYLRRWGPQLRLA